MIVMHALLLAASFSHAQTTCPASAPYTTTGSRLTSAVCEADYQDRLALLAPMQKDADAQIAAELVKQGCAAKPPADCKVVSRNRRDDCHGHEPKKCVDLRNQLDAASPVVPCRKSEDKRRQACLDAAAAYETKESKALASEKAADDRVNALPPCRLPPWPPVLFAGATGPVPPSSDICKKMLDEATRGVQAGVKSSMGESESLAQKLDAQNCPRKAPASAAVAVEDPGCAVVRAKRFEAEHGIAELDRCKPLIQSSNEACLAEAQADAKDADCKKLQSVYQVMQKSRDAICESAANPSPAALSGAGYCAYAQDKLTKLRSKLGAKGCSVP